MMVLLPHPDGPTIAVDSCGLILKLRFLRTSGWFSGIVGYL